MGGTDEPSASAGSSGNPRLQGPPQGPYLGQNLPQYQYYVMPGAQRQQVFQQYLNSFLTFLVYIHKCRYRIMHTKYEIF